MNPRYPVVAARAGHRCEYCHAPEAVFNLPCEVEHVLPPGAGGSSDESNLALACRSCNVFKSDFTEALDSETSRTARLFNPRLDDWSAHFQISDSSEIIGLTDIGRATLELLKMNAATQKAARLNWVRLGMYP